MIKEGGKQGFQWSHLCVESVKLPPLPCSGYLEILESILPHYRGSLIGLDFETTEFIKWSESDEQFDHYFQFEI